MFRREIAKAWRAGLVALACVSISADRGMAAENGSETVGTEKSFAELKDALDAAVKANDMLLVTRACASCGAAARGITIPGNMVVGVYRNDFALRMLEASVPAGIEAPIRFYLTEQEDGTAALSYRLPSTVFAPYENDELDALAKELDVIWARIIEAATD
jgi:uncharacterized protein (DUF302 family)